MSSEPWALLTVGRTVVDTDFRGDHAPNCHFAFRADRRKFVAILLETFARVAA